MTRLSKMATASQNAPCNRTHNGCNIIKYTISVGSLPTFCCSVKGSSHKNPACIASEQLKSSLSGLGGEKTQQNHPKDQHSDWIHGVTLTIRAQKTRNAIGCRSQMCDASSPGIINTGRINIFIHAESDPLHLLPKGSLAAALHHSALQVP